jgi:uncharacterized repeat protein (TIGR03806 family)
MLYRFLAFLSVIRRRPGSPGISAGVLLLVVCGGFCAEIETRVEPRVPWTNSKLVGRPEPAPPYTVERVFAGVEWKAPLYVAPVPGADRLLVVEQGGGEDRPSRIFRIANDFGTGRKERFLEMSGRLIYGLTFHPGFDTNGFFYVFSNGPTPSPDRTNRVSRFVMDRQEPRNCDPKSEVVILEWKSAGHDGGDLAFGRDGMLYITTGDGTSDSDGWVSGQDVGNLLACLLRIDVDHPGEGRPYSVPRDNPFVGVSGAREEIWAYGFRNPWRMTVDRKTGAIWVGNNGQDLWETAYRVNRGDNYGWSVYEGSHPFYLNRRRGPTPIVKPTLEHPHSEFRSLTGGVVYYGVPHSELNGTYVYGDYSTGKIWGARHDGTRLTWHGELADTALKIAAFALSKTGELLVVDHGDALYRLVKSPADDSWTRFPKRLSETGLFASVAKHQAEPGLIPYSVNAPGWVDGAQAKRFIGLSGESQIVYTSSGGWNFPDDTVLVQTLTMPASGDGRLPARRVETRLLVRQQGEWEGYSYLWNERQDEATLASKGGETIEFEVGDAGVPGGSRMQTWRVPSRTECMVCHGRAVNFVLGLSELQMNKVHGNRTDNQLRMLDRLGVFSKPLPKPPESLGRLVDPYDAGEDLEKRARSFLHANCAVCHVEAGGGNSPMVLQYGKDLDQMKVVGARPQHDTFGIADAMLIAPGDPDRSVLVQRISRRGRGQMPPLVSGQVDAAAVELFRNWISGMKPTRSFVREWTRDELMPALAQLTSGRSFESGRKAFEAIGCAQCHRFAGEGGSVGPELSGVGKRLKPEDLLDSMLTPSRVIATGYETVEIETVDGEWVAGRLEREDDEWVVLSAPAGVDEPVRILKTAIQSRKISQTSNMPEGMLHTLGKEGILDLMAYLLSDGKPGDPMFR